MSEILAATTEFGMQGSGDWSDPELRELDYRQTAFKLFQDTPTPFTKFLSMVPSSSVKDPQFRIYEWRLPMMAWTQTDAQADPDVTLVFEVVDGTGDGIKIGDFLKNERTGEIVRVTARTANNFTAGERGWGVGTGINSAVNDVWRWVGDAYAEGTDAPEAVSRRASVIENFCQIFKDSADITGTAKETDMRPFKSWTQLKAEALERLMIKMESSFLWGIQHETTGANGKPFRTTGGFYELIDAAGYSTDMSSITIDMLENELQTVFTYGSKKKMALIGYTALNYINKLVRDNTVFNFNAPLPKTQTYGLNVRTLTCPFGELGLIPHPLMAESAEYTDHCYIIDPKYVEYVYLRNRDVKWKDNSQGPGYDQQKGHFLAECGLRLALPECHAAWYGISSLRT